LKVSATDVTVHPIKSGLDEAVMFETVIPGVGAPGQPLPASGTLLVSASVTIKPSIASAAIRLSD